ncbi:MAG TPA: TIGR00725 family protein [Candidatus Thermoplasmatota archaeon]|nr:TIGR00725 family protein [Candidatus Thermoplasmatota archaeon]
MRTLVAVVGSDADDARLSPRTLTVAEEIGGGIARHGGILVCGGRGGVMEAACKGARAHHGVTVGILPEAKEEANEFVDIPLPTGLGMRRNFIVAYAADVVIAIGGRWGTLSEISFAMIFQRPVVLVEGTGGCVDELVRGNLMKESEMRWIVAHSSEDAVEKAFFCCSK